MNATLILVDLQNYFLPGGALAVSEGEDVIDIANALSPRFDLIVKTQDWHPSNHKSFASNHGLDIGTIIELNGLSQFLWPDHCIQHSFGAQFSGKLVDHENSIVFRKGEDPETDSYSAFFDNGHRNDTGLGDFLKKRKSEALYIMGLATDYCVKFTVLDALKLGFKTYLIVDGCRGVDVNPGDVESALQEMEDAGAILILSHEIKYV